VSSFVDAIVELADAETKADSSEKESGINRLVIPGLVHSFPALFYMVWSVPYFRFVGG
jgi:hypothetical protein